MSMTNLFFLPFVGHDYSAGGIFGKRVMVLFENHHCERSVPTVRLS